MGRLRRHFHLNSQCILSYFENIEMLVLRDRLMVGHIPLEDVILVRVQVPQQLIFVLIYLYGISEEIITYINGGLTCSIGASVLVSRKHLDGHEFS